MNSEQLKDMILQRGEVQSLPFWNNRSWKQYPFSYEWTEENYQMPAAEGWRPGNESQSWTLEGHIIGEETGQRYAFINIYNYNALGRILGFHWRYFQVTDLSRKKRYVERRYHFRPFPDIFKPPLDIKEGNLDLTYKPRGGGVDRWHTKRDPDGNLIPFEYHIDATGKDKTGEQVGLSLDVEALKPPMILGARDYCGKITMIGQPDTFSLSFPRFKVRGILNLPEKSENVEGIAWAGLQWAPNHFGKKGKPLKRIKHEVFLAQLSNGWDFSFSRQYDTFRCNRLMPFSGISGVLDDNTMVTTNNYTLESMSFFRNPRTAKPLLRTAPETHYYTHAARLIIPEWEADLVMTPLLEDNTISLFVEYIIGSTEITGTVKGKEVCGVGLTEHTKIWHEDHEFVTMIRNTLKYLPDQSFRGDREPVQRKLINDVEEVLIAADVRDSDRAKELLGAVVKFITENIREDVIEEPTASLFGLCQDFRERL